LVASDFKINFCASTFPIAIRIATCVPVHSERAANIVQLTCLLQIFTALPGSLPAN